MREQLGEIKGRINNAAAGCGFTKQSLTHLQQKIYNFKQTIKQSENKIHKYKYSYNKINKHMLS